VAPNSALVGKHMAFEMNVCSWKVRFYRIVAVVVIAAVAVVGSNCGSLVQVGPA
jgi:hypothetical protein